MWNCVYQTDHGIYVAVTRPEAQVISLVKFGSSSLSILSGRDIKTESLCFGIAYVNGKCIVATGYTQPYKVYSVTEDGRTETLHQTTSQLYYLAYDPRHQDVIVSLYTETEGATVVHRLSMEKKTTDVSKVGVVKHGLGVDVDRDGNVYVCGKTSNNVVQISRDGTIVRELVTSTSGLKDPYAISVYGDKFVVSNVNMNFVQIFQLSMP